LLVSTSSRAPEASPVDEAWDEFQGSAWDPAPPLDVPPIQALAGAPQGASESLDRKTIAVVFVHGIGSQTAAETLYDWAAPLIRTVWSWAEQQAELDGREFKDPVTLAEVDRSGQATSIIEIDLPGAAVTPSGKVHRPQRWVLTEVWWAGAVKPADIGEMANWGKAHVGAIITGIVTGIRTSVGRRNKDPLKPDEKRDVKKRLIADGFDAVAIGLLFTGLAAVAAPVYLVLRVLKSLPIPAFKDLTTAPLDWFLAEWFGDLRVLLHDRAQAANLRRRLALTIDKIRFYSAADEVVVVAHSGGTVLSYMFLADPQYAAIPVDKLITHGQAIGLAWRVGLPEGTLDPEYDAGLRRGDRLLLPAHRKGTATRPAPRWVDFHATHDVAPAFNARGWPPDPSIFVPAPGDDRDGPDESWTVANRMSVRNDHGGYWENEEQFVIPLLRELDTPGGSSADSRFYPERDEASRRRVLRRESRVRALSTWWNAWMLTLGAGLLAAGAFGVATVDMGLGALGRGAAPVLQPLPIVGFLGGLPGPALGAIIMAIMMVALSQLGVGAWNVMNDRERIAARRFDPPMPSRTATRGRMLLLLAAGVAVAWFGIAPGPAPLVTYVVLLVASFVAPITRLVGLLTQPSGWLPERDRDPGTAGEEASAGTLMEGERPA
jgi:hypothetical protein